MTLDENAMGSEVERHGTIGTNAYSISNILIMGSEKTARTHEDEWSGKDGNLFKAYSDYFTALHSLYKGYKKELSSLRSRVYRRWMNENEKDNVQRRFSQFLEKLNEQQLVLFSAIDSVFSVTP